MKRLQEHRQILIGDMFEDDELVLFIFVGMERNQVRQEDVYQMFNLDTQEIEGYYSLRYLEKVYDSEDK